METPEHISSVSEICGDVLFFSAPCCVVVVIPFNAHCLIFSHVFVEYRIIRFSFFTNYTRRIIIQGFLFSAADPLLLRLGTVAKISVILQSRKCAKEHFFPTLQFQECETDKSQINQKFVLSKGLIDFPPQKMTQKCFKCKSFRFQLLPDFIEKIRK